MSVLNVSRFYRKGTSRFVLVGSVARTGAVGYRASEGWERASGLFDDPGALTSSVQEYLDTYSDTYHGTLYAGYASPLFHVALSGRYGRTNMNTVRPIDYLAFSQTAFGKFGGNGYGARIETGINLVRWKRIDFQPFVGFDWELLKYDAFNEFGSAAYNMHFSDVDFDSYLLEVGLRLRAPTDLDDGTWIYPEIEVGYRHEFGEVGRLASSFFIADSLRTRMLVRGAEPARDSFVGAVRWAVSITDDAEAFAGYNIWADSRLVEHQATGGVRVRW